MLQLAFANELLVVGDGRILVLHCMAGKGVKLCDFKTKSRSSSPANPHQNNSVRTSSLTRASKTISAMANREEQKAHVEHDLSDVPRSARLIALAGKEHLCAPKLGRSEDGQRLYGVLAANLIVYEGVHDLRIGRLCFLCLRVSLYGEKTNFLTIFVVYIKLF